MSFYKFTDQRAVTAYQHNLDDKAAVYAEADAFMALFGEGACYFSGRPQFQFAGIKFKPRMDTLHWSIPTTQNNGMQSPRSTQRGMTPEQKEEGRALRKQWVDNYPKLKSNIVPVFAAMGFDWNWMNGYLIFKLDDIVYLEMDCAPSTGIEILGSEFQAAHAKVTA